MNTLIVFFGKIFSKTLRIGSYISENFLCSGYKIAVYEEVFSLLSNQGTFANK